MKSAPDSDGSESNPEHEGIFADCTSPRNLTTLIVMRAGSAAQLLDLAAPFFRRDPLFARAAPSASWAVFSWPLPRAREARRSRARAASRFCACVRCSRLSMSRTSSAIMRLPARLRRRSFTSSGSDDAADVEAQLDRRRHFVDVLPARPRGPNESLFDVLFVHAGA